LPERFTDYTAGGKKCLISLQLAVSVLYIACDVKKETGESKSAYILLLHGMWVRWGSP